ncbi:unnamed protein product [Didymodactylos carnosus]|uniref:Uncharacterized protein n=1 Tax=Didymodactylos carnosus TaxID=1234261 RepID=A0A8S2DD23_9BILA|nr:unnamed protein product [Didymodactylos carnosus]CAF3649837.1 unnamed protein product [Didymodactylos carnosus]
MPLRISPRANITEGIQTIVDAIQIIRANQQAYLKLEEKLKRFNYILQNTENQLEAKPSVNDILTQLNRTKQSAEKFLSQYNGLDCFDRNTLYDLIKTDLGLLNKNLTQDVINTLLCGYVEIPQNKLEAHIDVRNEDTQKLEKKSYTMSDFDLLFNPIREYYRKTFSRIERLVNRGKDYSIDNAYINLSIVDSEEQSSKEENFHLNANYTTFEQIYGTKSSI